MIVGCPKEIKPHEGRVSILPFMVSELVQQNNAVVVQSQAGIGAGVTDDAYRRAGARVVDTAEKVYGVADMIVKVKEPLPQEYKLFRRGQTVFTYFHFAASFELTQAMQQTGATCIAYETVEAENRLPLLEPMSEVAGRMAIQEGMHFLEAHRGGKGVLLGGVPGVKHGKVVILGGGVVGTNAAKVAAGIGADVVVMDKSLTRLRMLDDILPRNCTTRYSCEEALRQELPTCDLLVGAVLLPGRATPKLVRREHLSLMNPGSVIVDVAVDHGGCCETIKTTHHEEPTYKVDGILHYGVANMPGAVPRTSTLALTNATAPYVLMLAKLGWKQACASSPALRKGLNIVDGKVVHKGVAESLLLPWFVVEGLPDNVTLRPTVAEARPQSP